MPANCWWSEQSILESCHSKIKDSQVPQLPQLQAGWGTSRLKSGPACARHLSPYTLFLEQFGLWRRGEASGYATFITFSLFSVQVTCEYVP